MTENYYKTCKIISSELFNDNKQKDDMAAILSTDGLLMAQIRRLNGTVHSVLLYVLGKFSRTCEY